MVEMGKRSRGPILSRVPLIWYDCMYFDAVRCYVIDHGTLHGVLAQIDFMINQDGAFPAGPLQAEWRGFYIRRS